MESRAVRAFVLSLLPMNYICELAGVSKSAGGWWWPSSFVTKLHSGGLRRILNSSGCGSAAFLSFGACL